MAKRFTDNTKWRHPSFRAMPLKARLTWLYLLDECDHAGFWLADYSLATFQLGFNLTLEDLTSWFGDKLFFAGDKRIFIPDFVRFQQGVKKNEDLNPKHNPHLGILKEFEAHSVSLDFPGIPLSKGYPTINEGLPNPPGISSSSSSGLEKGGVGEKTKPTLADFQAIYDKYPRKEGKGKGLAICKVQIRSQEDLAALSLAVDRYIDKLAREGTEPKFFRHFSTFMGSWRDWLEADAGTAPKLSKGKSDYSYLEAK
jgi:hypothetical protein